MGVGMHAAQSASLSPSLSSFVPFSFLHPGLPRIPTQHRITQLVRSAWTPLGANRVKACSAWHRMLAGAARRHYLENSSPLGGDGDVDGEGGLMFERAVALFNGGDYHACHDVLEDIWNGAEEPTRTLVHGILQCAVGLHHLFNRNHRGAMMELGEGLCKLRKMRFEGGPFYKFEQEVSATLEFLYQTQKELAACTEDLCLSMDGSNRSYQLLGSFGAGKNLYTMQSSPTDDVAYIVFRQSDSLPGNTGLRVKVPALDATEEHLKLLC